MHTVVGQRASLILISLFVLHSSVDAMVLRDTRVGVGADTELANDNPAIGAAFADEARGTLQPNSMNTRLSIVGPFAQRHRASMMRFDLSGIAGPFSDAGLLVHSVDQSRRVEVWGLGEDAGNTGLEDWIENEVTYNTAPSFTNQGSEEVAGVLGAPWTKLGEWVVPGPRSNGFDRGDVSTTFGENDPNVGVLPDMPTQFTPDGNVSTDFSANLSSFLANDTNDKATILFFPTATQTNGNVAFRTKEYEFTTDDQGNTITRPEWRLSPTLILPNASEGPPGPISDLNGDGNVDGADLLLGQQQGLDAAFYTAFNAEYGTMAPNGFAAVPEPTTAVAALAVCYLSVASGYVTRRGRGR